MYLITDELFSKRDSHAISFYYRLERRMLEVNNEGRKAYLCFLFLSLLYFSIYAVELYRTLHLKGNSRFCGSFFK